MFQRSCYAWNWNEKCFHGNTPYKHATGKYTGLLVCCWGFRDENVYVFANSSYSHKRVIHVTVILRLVYAFTSVFGTMWPVLCWYDVKLMALNTKREDVTLLKLWKWALFLNKSHALSSGIWSPVISNSQLPPSRTHARTYKDSIFRKGVVRYLVHVLSNGYYLSFNILNNRVLLIGTDFEPNILNFDIATSSPQVLDRHS